MSGGQQLRRVLALLCIAGVVLAAVFPGNTNVPVADFGPAVAFPIPIIGLAVARRSPQPGVASLLRYLAATAERAPPAHLMEVL